MLVRKGRWGRTIRAARLAKAIARKLRTPKGSRRLRARLRPIRPAITHVRLRSMYRTVVTVDKRTLHLRLFKRLRHRKTYRIALGMAGYDTPAGRYRIQSKQVNPSWTAPNRPWAGSMAGQTVPGGAPNNPLKARWLGVDGSVGIHGTAEEWSIGTRASHGCIRMRVRDVIDLYRRVPLGSTVLIR
jgi:lipoprotein-anchoring transpeptidase ErfK/SrfK